MMLVKSEKYEPTKEPNSMSLISDFYTYCSCYEIPRNYAIGAALGLLGSTIHRRAFVKQGDIAHYCTNYIVLVGAPGNKKTTAMGIARKFYRRVYPQIPIGSSVQSRESIIKFMSSPEGAHYFENHEGTTVEFHPFMLYVNELENFLSFNLQGMVAFLVDIYNEDYFDSSTIIRGTESFPNPTVNMLACVPPRWLTSKLKLDIISGGICRRMIFIYEQMAKDDSGNLIIKPRPVITPEARAAEQRVLRHLERLASFRGEYKWTPDGERFFDAWYTENKLNLPEDPIMNGFAMSMDMQLLKIAMMIDAANDEPKMLLTEDILASSLGILESFKINMPKLSVAAGRNELAGPQQEFLAMLEAAGGFMTEKEFLRKTEKDLNGAEQKAVLWHLEESEQVVKKRIEHKGAPRVLIMTKEFYEKLEKAKATSTPPT